MILLVLGVTVTQIYCDSSTWEAFSYTFKAFFTSIEKATGHQLKFKAFDVAGNIRTLILDMEVAQVRDLGDALV
jgi:hypothetical protein